MAKFSKLKKAIKILFKKPYLLNDIINHNEVWKDFVQEKYPDFVEFPTVLIQDIFSHTDTKVDINFLGGGSTVLDIALLKALAQRYGCRSYFEIGTWRGESVLNVSKVVADCTTLNLSQQQMKEKGWGDRYAKLHGVLSKSQKGILHLLGDTKTFDFKGLGRTYDLIFIDGDHHYEMIKNDTRHVFENLVSENTIVVWHDYAFHPEEIRYQTIAGILQGIDPSLHDNLFHLSTTLCAVYFPEKYRKEISSLQLQKPVDPSFLFTVPVQFEPVASNRN